MTDERELPDPAYVTAYLESVIRKAINDLGGDPELVNMEMSALVIACEFKYLDRDLEQYLTFNPLGTVAAARGLAGYSEQHFRDKMGNQ